MKNALIGWGWAYFILSIIGAMVIWANYSLGYTTSTEIVIYGFAVILQGIMVFIVFLALAKILEKLDNIKI